MSVDQIGQGLFGHSQQFSEHCLVVVAGRVTRLVIGNVCFAQSHRGSRAGDPAGLSVKNLSRTAPFAQMWILLASGEYVRYDTIVSISDPARAD